MRAKTLTAALMAAVMTVGLWSAPVHAAEDGVPGGFASWDELFATQLKMIPAADVVTAAAGGAEGLAGISAKPERREVWVYWKGDPPAGVADASAPQRRQASEGNGADRSFARPVGSLAGVAPTDRAVARPDLSAFCYTLSGAQYSLL